MEDEIKKAITLEYSSTPYSDLENSSRQIVIKTHDEYTSMCKMADEDPVNFWRKWSSIISWTKEWETLNSISYSPKPDIKWFLGGTLNACYNCIDRHIDDGFGDTIAVTWESSDLSETLKLTFAELKTEICKFSNVLKKQGVVKGDRVCIYLQMVPQMVVAVLGCARIGAVHNVVFGGFSTGSLTERINDSDSKVVITQDLGVRGAKHEIPMFQSTYDCFQECPGLKKLICVKKTGDANAMDIISKDEKCVYYEEEMASVNAECPCEEMDSEDPLFILYTSGSTGKPKGMYHTTGGYMVWAAYTNRLSFDLQRGDILYCTADVGWITGHTYIVYGPLSLGANVVMFEGVPTYPHMGVLWEICQKHQVRVFYTAPTAIRALMKSGDEHVLKYDRSSIKILGTVGETIKAPEWHWYNNIVGGGKCHVVDTFWQTETGGHMISNLPYTTQSKPGSAMNVIPGVKLAILDINTNEKLESNDVYGKLCFEAGWPGQARGVWGDADRFNQVYFQPTPGYYFAGDGCYRDVDGHIWITGRIDDIIISAGHNLSSAELELTAQQYGKVVEAAAVGIPDEIKGYVVVIFVVLALDNKEDEESVVNGVIQLIRNNIGPIASPKSVKIVPDLPKTRSGKIMRRILRKIECDEIDTIGDVSTLANPDCVKLIIETVKK